MLTIFHIYLYCVVLSLVFMVLVLTKIKSYADEDESSRLKYVYAIFIHAPKYFHFMAVFMPVVNLVFASMALLVIFKLISHWFVMRWLELTYKVLDEFIKKPSKHFRAKYFILRHIFPKPCLKIYQLALTNDEKLFNNVLNLLKKIANEEKERKPECDPEHDTMRSDQETPAQREEN